MKAGDTVKLRNEWREPHEKDARYILLDDTSMGRVDIQLICDLPFPPIERVDVAMIEKVAA